MSEPTDSGLDAGLQQETTPDPDGSTTDPGGGQPGALDSDSETAGEPEIRPAYGQPEHLTQQTAQTDSAP